ncbi:MAG: efflux RND transporter periplasmic adaptor subunit [Phycisphaerae bacterium]|nr:efflux RND transporter periplasmic adaptor subunit [Phycisphaerae bacterium]
MKTIIGIVLLGVAVGGIYVLNDKLRNDDGESILHVAQQIEVPVEIATPERRDIIRTVQAPGEVEAFDEVDISSEVMGKILEMPVEEGDTVEAGELVCRLDDADYRARLLSREATVGKLRALITQAEAALDKAQRDWDHIMAIDRARATSRFEIADYETAVITAQANLEMRRQELIEAEAMLQSAQEDLDRTVIRAPLSGIVSQRFAEVGEVVITGTMNNPGTRVMVISDLSRMQVRCRVDEEDAPLVAADQPARIYLQSDTRRSIPGRVLRVGTKGTKQLGRDVVTFETLVLITSDDKRVRPGMTASVEIEVDRREQALTIPVQSVVHRKRRDLPDELVKEHDRLTRESDEAVQQNVAEYIKLVFCVVDGKAEARLAQTGISDARGVEVIGGVGPDDKVVVGPYRSLDSLKDDSQVKIEEKKTAEKNHDSDKPDDPAAAATATQPASTQPSDPNDEQP